MDHSQHVSASFLKAQTGTNVRLTFMDGEIVVAHLLAVDPVREHDLTYEVVKIIAPGSPRPRGSEAGATCIAPLVEVKEWQPED